MKSGSQIAWDDTVLPFQLDACDMRGRIARLDGVLDGVLQQHNYPPVGEALVSEMALLTALIGESIKLRWKLSLQVQSKGAVRMIATDYYGPETEGAPARIRAYASFDEARAAPEGASERFASAAATAEACSWGPSITATVTTSAVANAGGTGRHNARRASLAPASF